MSFRSCIVTARDIDTHDVLIVLDMLDFNVILSMDGLSYYHAVMNYFAKIVTYAIPGIPPAIWQGAVIHEPTETISYICTRRLISRVCKSNLTYVHDNSVESPSLDSILLVCEFPDVFPIDLPSIPLARKIKFAIDLEDRKSVV